VRELISLANRAVVSRQSAAEATQDMRSTLVVWVCDPARNLAAWGHTGDSRLYCFRAGRVLLRTRDHSLYQAMIEAGIADAMSLRGNPQRNVLTASLGSLEDVEVDVTPSLFPLAHGDAFLLCSDGFWDMLSEPEMEAALAGAASPQAWIDDLADRVAGEARLAQDNYSALAIWCRAPA
jgi:serine/threonine protein phosphatase PrpC